MLGKLIKYEFKALYKKILLCVVGGLLISLLTLLLFQLAVASNGNNFMLQLFWSSGMIFTILALRAARHSDAGYLIIQALLYQSFIM